MKNKDRYNLSELEIIVSRAERINYYNLEVFHKFNKLFARKGLSDMEILTEILGWLEQEYSPLTNKEKEYLSAVIKPWRNDVKYVRKERVYVFPDFERIWITYKSVGGIVHMHLPNFERGTMYQGMELNKEYSLEDLGL